MALVYLNPDDEYSITEVAHRIGASVKAVHQEVTRLVETGLLADRKLRCDEDRPPLTAGRGGD